MADSLISILNKLDVKIKGLTAEIEQLRIRNEALETENENLRRQAEEANAERDRALLDAEYLAVSHQLADNPDNIVKTRRQISQLIRNIDRCLEMLKE